MLTYYLVVPFLYFLAYFPSSVLYLLSDVLAFVLRAVVRYRRSVVYDNLKKSFPEKSEKEIADIAKESYTHLADRVVENIKCLTISKEEINRRMLCPGIELLNNYYLQRRHVVIMVGHIGSWEFGGYKMAVACRHNLFGIVSLVKNPYFNRMIQRTRGKMGMHLIPMNESKEFFKQPLQRLSMGVFISDQSPSNPDKAYWTNFMNQETAFFKGAEAYARTHNCVVVYPKIVQQQRGHYQAELITITETPQATTENEITEKFVRLLEQQIHEHPADWLWSHKRWKHIRQNN